MSQELFKFTRCPNCGRRSFWVAIKVFRCPVCFGFCCERCITKHTFSRSCPHCNARSAVKQVGYTS